MARLYNLSDGKDSTVLGRLRTCSTDSVSLILLRMSCASSFVGLSIRDWMDGAKMITLLCNTLAVELACNAVVASVIDAEIVTGCVWLPAADELDTAVAVLGWDVTEPDGVRVGEVAPEGPDEAADDEDEIRLPEPKTLDGETSKVDGDELPEPLDTEPADDPDVESKKLDGDDRNVPETDELELPVALTTFEFEKVMPLPVGPETPLTSRFAWLGGKLRFIGGLPASAGRMIGDTSMATSGTKVRGSAFGCDYLLGVCTSISIPHRKF